MSETCLINALNVEGLTVSRGARRLFEGLSLSISAGEAVMLSGANGAGKTSLLRAIAGLLRPEAGTVSFGEIEPEAARAGALHLIGHHDGLKSQRTAADEFEFWSDWLGGAPADRARAIEAFQLEPLMRLDVRVLSAGQRRRLALSRLRAAPRPLWLLDEPMAPLDTFWRAALGQMMLAHLRTGGMILAAAHDPLPIPARIVEVGG